MQPEDVNDLLKKYKAGQCTPEEEAALSAWLHQHNQDGESGLSDQDFERAEVAMLRQINAARFSTGRKIRLWPRIAAAAAIIGFVLATGLWLYLDKNPDKTMHTNTYTQVIKPGKEGATLTLSSGRKIRLADAGQGTFAEDSGVKISKNANGEVIYSITGKDNGNGVNTLSTARGETFQIRLPDGTKIWLNAASRITYPASFAGLAERRVTLAGEGYFEVAKDKMHPFIVESAGQEVAVLGTHFNIEAYGDEPKITTTLLEGKVNVRKDGQVSALHPGQQAEVSKGSAAVIRLITDANIDEAVAWKENKFVFAGDDIRAVMRKLSRWYDVEVDYQPGLTAISFGGSISRDKDLKDVLKVLEITRAVHFRIEGRRIMVMP